MISISKFLNLPQSFFPSALFRPLQASPLKNTTTPKTPSPTKPARRPTPSPQSPSISLKNLRPRPSSTPLPSQDLPKDATSSLLEKLAPQPFLKSPYRMLYKGDDCVVATFLKRPDVAAFLSPPTPESPSVAPRQTPHSPLKKPIVSYAQAQARAQAKPPAGRAPQHTQPLTNEAVAQAFAESFFFQASILLPELRNPSTQPADREKIFNALCDPLKDAYAYPPAFRTKIAPFVEAEIRKKLGLAPVTAEQHSPPSSPQEPEL